MGLDLLSFEDLKGRNNPRLIKLIGLSYVATSFVMLVFALVGYISCEPKGSYDGCSFGHQLFLMLASFHGTSWGLNMSYVLPGACLAMSLGYLWPLVTVLVIIREAGHPLLFKNFAMLLG